MPSSCLVFALLAAIPSTLTEKSDDLLSMELARVREVRLADVGRAALVARYQQLIDNHPGNSRVAEAMIDVASLCENVIQEKGILADPKAALIWWRKAVATARVGSATWIKAQFYLCNRVDGPEERREILERITASCNGKLVVLAQVEHALIGVCLEEHRLVEAEEHFLAVVTWNHDPAKVPKVLFEKGEIDSLRFTAGSEMIDAWSRAPWPKEVRRWKVSNFLEQRCFDGGFLRECGERALDRIDAEPDEKP